MKKLRTIAQWAPIVLLALPLIAFGSAKLAGVPDFHVSFEAMGLPTWFGYAIGCVEVLGGIGLLIPRLSALAATGIIPIMIGDTAQAIRLSDRLLDMGIFVVGFGFPVVPEGAARLRVQMSSEHSAAQIERTLDAFQTLHRH